MEDPEGVPSEDEILTAADGLFSIERWKVAADAGKYTGYEVEMAQHLAQRVLAENRRRWRIRWRDREVTEDNYTLNASKHAETYAGKWWAQIVIPVNFDIQFSRSMVQALLYGMARDVLGMSDQEARDAVEGPELNNAFLESALEYYEIDDDSPKDGPPPSVTT